MANTTKTNTPQAHPDRDQWGKPLGAPAATDEPGWPDRDQWGQTNDTHDDTVQHAREVNPPRQKPDARGATGHTWAGHEAGEPGGAGGKTRATTKEPTAAPKAPAKR